MQNEILNYLSKTHAQYIHARGEIATRVLIQTLNCKPNEDVLEIGFGTGTTLAQLFSNNKSTRFCGLELSSSMYKKAKARLRFSLIGESVKLSLMKQKEQIPFEANSFDKIYLESVLGIQEGNDLEVLLKEIRRVLRPNGFLLMNETIWLNTTSLDEIDHINGFCKRSFGIILSSSEYPYLQSWLDLLKKLNFKCESVIKLDEIKNTLNSEFKFSYRLLSLTFTAIGKIKSNLSPSMIKEKKRFHQKTKQLNPDNKLLMEGVIFKALNQK